MKSLQIICAERENLRCLILDFIADPMCDEDEAAWKRHLQTYDELLNSHTVLLAEVKRLRLLFRELINDMSADEYTEWCNRIGCPDGLEVEAMKND